MNEVKEFKKGIKKEYKIDLKNLKRDYKTEKRRLRSEYKNRKLECKTNCNEKSEASSSESSVQTSAAGRARGLAPRRSVLEEVGNAVSHGVGSAFSIFALAAMLMKSSDVSQVVAACVYGIGMFLMFTMSCLYHSFRYGTAVKRVFRRFDYLSIYLLIGATFAPLLLCYAQETFGRVFFIVQWLIIITGITLVAVFGPARLRKIHIPLYFILGWSGLVLLPTMVVRGDLGLLWWILGGGLLYTVGIIPFAVDKRVAHFIWHLFVLFGAVVQWIGIYLFIY